MIIMAALMILLTTAIHATAMFFMLERLASDKDGPVKNFLAKHNKPSTLLYSEQVLVF